MNPPSPILWSPTSPRSKSLKIPRAISVEKLKVAIVENTNLIRVALELPNPDEAVTIVKAVVQSYLAQNTDYSRSANRDLTDSLKQQLVKIGEEIKRKRENLKELYKKGNVTVLKPQDRLNTTNDADVTQPTFKTVSENHVEKMMAEMAQTDLQLIEAQSMLEVKRDAYKAMLEASQQATQQGNEQQLARDRARNSKKTPKCSPSSKRSTIRASISTISSKTCGSPTTRPGLRPRSNSISCKKSIKISGRKNTRKFVNRLTGSVRDTAVARRVSKS